MNLEMGLGIPDKRQTMIEVEFPGESVPAHFKVPGPLYKEFKTICRQENHYTMSGIIIQMMKEFIAAYRNKEKLKQDQFPFK